MLNSKSSLLLLCLVVGLTLGCETTYHLFNTSDHRIVLSRNASSSSPIVKEFTYLTEFLSELNSPSECDTISVFLHSGVYVLAARSVNVTVYKSITIKGYGRDDEDSSDLDSSSSTSNSDVKVTCQEAINSGTNSGVQLWFSSESSQSSTGGAVSINGITFEACAHSLRFDYLNELKIRNSIFRYFNSPAVDISSVLDIKVHNCQFTGNNVTSLNDRFRAGAAGLSIAYNFQVNTNQLSPILSISSTRFIGNAASTPSILLNDQIQRILEENVYPARGGSLGIVIIDSFGKVSVSISKCEFLDNFAEEFGGAIYISMRGRNTNHSLSLSDSTFQRNRCNTGGGAIVAGFNVVNQMNVSSVMEIIDCKFDSNSANSSGAVLVAQLQNIGTGNFIVIRRTNFTANIGHGGSAAITVESIFNVLSRQFIPFSTIEDCIFSDNNSTGGTMIAGFSKIEFIGNNIFSYNEGPSISATGSFVRIVSGDLIFFENNGATVDGGVALYLTGLSQVQIYKDAHMWFRNNIGSIGAAIRVDLPQLPELSAELIHNPLCFILYEDLTIPPRDWPPNLVHFIGNQALLGSAIYTSSVETCAYYRAAGDQAFDVSSFPDWPIFDFGENINTFHEGNKTDKRFYIQTPAKNISFDSSFHSQISLSAFPGETKELALTGLDQFNNPSYFVGRIIDRDKSLLESLVNFFDVSPSFNPPANYSIIYESKEAVTALFSPSLDAFTPSKIFTTKYSLELPSSTENKVVDDVVGDERQILLQIEESKQNIFEVNFILNVTACPPGYVLQKATESNRTWTCVCAGAENDQFKFAVLDCDDESNMIILRDGYWAGSHSSDSNTPHLDIYTCPITYCQCISDEETQSCTALYSATRSDDQCHPPREGFLCGTCGNGTVVTILRLQCNHNCEGSYTFIYATVILILADIAIIIGALLASIKFGIPFPHTLKGFTFYIQTLYYATEYFPITFWETRKYMLSLSNLIGLYFPVDFCFIENAPPISTFAPRFIPILLLIIISLIAGFFRKAKVRMWHGVWAIFQLLYIPLVHTCISLLHCPTFPDPADAHFSTNRWFLDGSTECFNDVSHIFLGTVAAIFLIASIITIPFIILITVMEDHSVIQEKFPGLINVIKALKAGYQNKFKWWASIELLQPLLFVGIIVGLPGQTAIPVLVLFFFFVLHLYLQPFKYNVQNIIKVLLLLNFIILLVFRFTQSLVNALGTYTGTLVPSKYGNEIPQYSLGINVFFGILFYFPVFVGVCICGFLVFFKVWKYIKARKEEEKKAAANSPMTKTDNMERIDENLRNSVQVTSSIVETI